MLLDIPLNVGITFAIFGIGGFLVYAFMYGALGALVSKVEDLNKSSGTAQMIVTLVYVLVLIKLTDVDGVLIKVLSFLPISSYSAMFARVAMGHVALWEVVLSAVILYASVVGMGFLGGKIFRSSTLRYGNPIKLTTAFKNLKSDKN
jgi:ABC-2 type transport system permease protein